MGDPILYPIKISWGEHRQDDSECLFIINKKWSYRCLTTGVYNIPNKPSIPSVRQQRLVADVSSRGFWALVKFVIRLLFSLTSIDFSILLVEVVL